METQYPVSKTTEDCVICLAPISDRAIVVPCNHYSFDFSCLAHWLHEQSKCPLCKVNVTAIEYDWRSPVDYQVLPIREPDYTSKTTTVTTSSDISTTSATASTTSQQSRRHRFTTRLDLAYDNEQDIGLLRRRNIYRYARYSKHIGCNAWSGFRPVTPHIFRNSLVLQQRARTWIRRELRVFDDVFREPRMRHAEMLMGLVVDLLRTVAAKSERAEEVLRPLLGRERTSLFLHELSSWLSSPFDKLEDWDSFVQYSTRALY